jgi:protein TonB
MFVAVEQSRPSLGAHHRSPYLRVALIVMAVHLMLFVLTPPFDFEPYRLDAEEFLVVHDVREIEIPPPPKEVPLPRDPTPIDDTDAADVELTPTSPLDHDRYIEPRPPDTRPKVGFAWEVRPPAPIRLVTPVYPKLAREAGIEGTVRVRVVIDTNGKVVDAVVVSSEVTPAMERAALEAARKCEFEPAKQRNIPVKVSVVIPFEFRLAEF